MVYKKIIIFIFSFLLISLPCYANSNIVKLQSQIEELLQNPQIPINSTAIKIVDLKNNQTIFSLNDTLPLVPASNLKIITSAAALCLLKPEFTFKTNFYIDGNLKQGILNGNLYIKGYGDPDLNTERLWIIAKELKYRGLKEIKGDIIGDDTYFDNERLGKGWKERYREESYSAKISALSLNYNTIKVYIAPTKQGELALVSLDPYYPSIKIKNSVLTSGSHSYIKINKKSSNEILVQGNIGINSLGEFEEINISEPAHYVAEVFKELLKKEGVKVNGIAKIGQTPNKVTSIYQSESRPLYNIIADFNKYSINFIGELILKYLGANFDTPPGTAEKGVNVIKTKFLEELVKADTSNFEMVDGSGLSDLNRVTANILVDVLKYMYTLPDVNYDFISSLSISGVDGTLRKRLKNTVAYRKIRAKTGSIAGVVNLSGYALNPNSPMAFSILSNNSFNYTVIKELQDKIGILLIQYNPLE